MQGNLGYARNLHDFKTETSMLHLIKQFAYGYEGCCWQTRSQNDLAHLESDSPTNQQTNVSFEFKMIAKVFDVTNVAPRIVLPSMWYVNIGCNSSLELRPFDQDHDDVIKCRWADKNEAGFAAFNASDQPFINLVSESCELEFDAKKFRELNATSDWSKQELSIPIAIMIEDFRNNLKRSSMPVQFLVATMPSSDTDGDDDAQQNVLDDRTDGGMDNGGDAETSQTMGPTEMANCALIPALSLIKDLVSSLEPEEPNLEQAQEPEMIRSFDIYEGGRNGNYLKKSLAAKISKDVTVTK